jgi:subtilisin family serine protease
MSFGFLRPVREIDEAIDHAHAKKVLMLAAAANCGGNASLSWPARSSLVISVHAATGEGNWYRSTPTRRSYANNFATLGSAVLSWWPVQKGLGPQVRKSGTSTATPVLAAIAATIISIVRQPGRVRSEEDLEILKRLGTADGMRAVLRRMVGENGDRHGYDYIAPWELLDVSLEQHLSPDTIVDNILRDLNRF